MEKFSEITQVQDTLFESHYKEMGSAFKSLLESNQSPDVQAILESFDTTPYALDEKIVKSKSDISYVFKDEAGDRYRIQFLVSPKFGKGVAKVYIGKGKGARLFVDKIDRFTNPKAMIATVINFFSEHLLTPEGMTLRGFIVDLSGAAAIRSIPVLKKVIKSALVSKIKVADDTFQPQDGRKYLWITKSTLKPADVFNGPGAEGAPWFQGKEKVEDKATAQRGDAAGVKKAKFDPMSDAQIMINSVLPILQKKYPDIEMRPTMNSLRMATIAVYVNKAPICVVLMIDLMASKGVHLPAKEAASVIENMLKNQFAMIDRAEKKAKEESERAMNLKKDPAFYLKQQQAAIEGEINLKLKGYGFTVKFYSDALSKDFVTMFVLCGENQAAKIECPVDSSASENAEYAIKELRSKGINGVNPFIPYMTDVTVLNASSYFPTSKSELAGRAVGTQPDGVWVKVGGEKPKFLVKWSDIKIGTDSTGRVDSQIQTASGKVKVQKDPVIDQLVDYGFKDVKQIVDNKYKAITKTGVFIFEMEAKGMKPVSVSSSDGAYTDRGPWSYDVLRALQTGAYWLGTANRDMRELNNDIVKLLANDLVAINRSIRELGFKIGLFKTKANAGSEKEALQVEREFVSEAGQVFKFHMFGVWKPQDADMEVNVRFEKVGSGTFAGLQDTARVAGPTNTASPFVRIAGDLFDGFLAELQKEVSAPVEKARPQIVKAKWTDRLGTVLTVTYNSKLNAVFLKDASGQDYHPSKVMFMHHNMGNPEIAKFFRSEIREVEPDSSAELVKVLTRITQLPGWKEA